MVYLVKENYATYYHSVKSSKAFLFCILIYFLMLILPLMIGFSGQNFWVIESSYYEQPTVRYLDQYIIVLQTSDNSYFYTNIPQLMKSSPVSQTPPIVSVEFIHNNERTEEKSKIQNFTATIQFQQDPLTINYMEIFIFFEYRLVDSVQLVMQSYAQISLKSQGGIQKGLILGQLGLKQIVPLRTGNTPRQLYNYPPFYDEDGGLLTNLVDIVQNNHLRNETIDYQYQSFIQRASDTINNYCEIEVLLQVPQNQKILYTPSLLETLKYAWVQYFSTFLIFWYLGHELLLLVVENQVFNTHKFNDLPQIKKTYTKNKLN